MSAQDQCVRRTDVTAWANMVCKAWSMSLGAFAVKKNPGEAHAVKDGGMFGMFAFA